MARSRQYLVEIIMDADDIVLLANTHTQAECLLHSLEQAEGGIGFHMNADKTDYKCFNQDGAVSTLNGSSLKLVDMFMYLGSSISSTESDINMHLAKVWTAIKRISIIWMSDLSNKTEQDFFHAMVVSILQYKCTTWILIKQRKS